MGILNLKYVMIDGAFPVLFAPLIEHKKMKFLGNVTSAGFVRVAQTGLDGVKVETFDRSHSLNLGPEKLDADIIQEYLNER